VGSEMTVSELRAMLEDQGLMRELPLSKVMIDFIVELVKKKEND
jgi:hypothetical protein